MLIDKEIYEDFMKKYLGGYRIPRSKKIWYNNIEGVKKAGIKYAMNYDELSEYTKCSNDIKYFAEKYCKILLPNKDLQHFKLRKYQKEILENFDENRFNIWMGSRQIGTSYITAIIILHQMIFFKKNVLFLNNKSKSIIDMVDKIKMIFKSLPMFLKPGVETWSLKTIKFDNNSRVSNTLGDYDNVDIFVLDDFSRIKNNDILYTDIITNVATNSEKRIFITSQPNGNNIFTRLVQDADNKENLYTILKTYWWEVPGRDEEWKKNMIKMLSSEKTFLEEFELSFLSKKPD